MTAATPEERLAGLGHTLPQVVPPVAAYLPTVRSGNHVYVSGQLPVVDGELGATGKVGADVTPERARELAVVCALNALAAIKAEVGRSEERRVGRKCSSRSEHSDIAYEHHAI